MYNVYLRHLYNRDWIRLSSLCRYTQGTIAHVDVSTAVVRPIPPVAFRYEGCGPGSLQMERREAIKFVVNKAEPNVQLFI